MNHVIVTSEEIKRWQSRARLGWIALGVGVALSVIGAFGSGYFLAYRQAMGQAEVVTERQDASARFLVQAWQDQRNGIDLINATAGYIREKERIVQFNKENNSPEVPKEWKKKTKEQVRLSSLSPR